MRKPKIYLDTSVISNLEKDALILWEELKTNKFQVIISNITVAELSKFQEPKRTAMLEKITELEYQIIEENNESLSLAERYINFGVLKRKCLDNLRHIAVASMVDCKYIVSCSFHQLVNINTIERVQAANKVYGYNDIFILPPTMIAGGTGDDIYNIRYTNYEKIRNMTHQEIFEHTHNEAQYGLEFLKG